MIGEILLPSLTFTPTNYSVGEAIKVDSSGLTRESSNGRQSRVDIEIFQFAINRILKEGKISRSEINDHYEKRGSSIVAAVLCQCPSFEQVGTSSIIRLKPQGARRY